VQFPPQTPTKTTWPGYYYDGHTSTRHPVAIFLTPGGLEIRRLDGITIFWPYSEVTQTQGQFGHEPVRLEHGHPVLKSLVIEDPNILPALQAHARRHGTRFHIPLDFSRRLWIILGAGVASIAVTVGLILWGIPALAELLTPFVPTSWETALGKAVVTQLAPSDLRCTNNQLKSNIDAILARLVSASSAHTYSFHVTIVDGRIFNAFAAPGGEIVVLRPLLEATEAPEELAGVLAHELQHVLLRHSTKALIRDLSVAALVGAVFGDVSGVGAFAVQAGRTLTTLRYSRDSEEQADHEGLRLLQRARIDPAGMIGFFDTLHSRTANVEMPEYLSTHPQSQQRVIHLKSLLGEGPAASEPIKLEGTWKEIKQLCH